MNKWVFALVLFLPLLGHSQNWEKDFDAALIQSEKEEKPILLVFSGSDWCAPCIKLDRKIWQSETFKTYAGKHYVLYKADFPKKKKNRLAPEVMNTNKALAERYNRKGFFPLVLILGKNGEVLGKTGFKNYGPKKYVDHLEAFLK